MAVMLFAVRREGIPEIDTFLVALWGMAKQETCKPVFSCKVNRTKGPNTRYDACFLNAGRVTAG